MNRGGILKKEKWPETQSESDKPEWGTVLAFLQARMGSTRLPGKVLMPIQGQTILERAIRRLQASPAVDGVAVLTTKLEEDNPVEHEARKLGAMVYRGPELDVLTRFQEASDIFGPDIIIRATADNPLIDIGSIERIVRVLHSDLLDLCIEKDLPYGAATEAVRARALKKADMLARDPRHREHVTLFIKECPQEFSVAYLTPPHTLRCSQIRLTVDTMDDFQFMNHLIAQIPEQGRPVSLNEYIPLALSE